MRFASNHPDITLPASFEAEVTRRVIAGDRRSVLYIVPTGAEARDLINRVTTESRGRALMLPHILSLGEFITALREVVRPELQLISAGQSAALIELAMRELFARGELHYFEERSSTGPALPVFQGTFDEIVAAINGLKEQGVSVERLGELLARTTEENSDRRKLQDIHTIYSAYTDKIRDSLVDLYGQYFILIDKLQLPIDASEEQKCTTFGSFFRRAFPNVKDVFIAPFVRFTTPALDLLLPLGLLDDLNVTFGLDLDPSNPELFQFQKELSAILEQRGFLEQTLIGGMPTRIDDFRSHIRGSLFSRRNTGPQFEATDLVEEHKAASIEEEVRFVARALKELLAREDAPNVKRIAIASTDQELYAPVLRSVFRDYGIPVQLTHRQSLAQLPIYHAFEYLLELGFFRLSRRRVRAVIESPYFRLKRADGTQLDRHALLSVLTRYHFPQGASEWHGEMDELIADLEYRAGLSFEDDFERRNVDRDLAELRIAREDILVLEGLITRLAGERTPKMFVNDVRAIFRELDVVGCILQNADAMLSSDMLEVQTRGFASLDTLLAELESLCGTLSLSNELLDLGFYLERLRTASTRARSAERAEPGSAVIVTSFDQLIGNEYDHVFLLGLREGLFPRSFHRSLFTPSDHAKTHDVHLHEQRFEFYQTLCTFRNHLTLSWHTGTEDGTRMYNRSVALEALRRIAKCEETEGVRADPVLSRSEFFRAVAADMGSMTAESLTRVNARAESGGLDSAAGMRLREIQPEIIGAERVRRTTPDSVYAGTLPLDELSEEERMRLDAFRERVYSITQLETYASCGFKFFSRFVLGLSMTEVEEEDGLEASERGTILHNSLFRLLERFKERGWNLRTMGEAALPAARAIIDELYPPAELERMHPFKRLDHSQLFDSSPGHPSVIERFIAIEQDSKLRDVTSQPAYFELAFGQRGVARRDEYPDHPEPVEIGGIRLRGKIDRIDMDPSGSFVVVDYKSGAAPAAKQLSEGLSLQLPLYLRIAEDLLRAHLGDKEVRGVAAMYHSLKASDKPREFRFLLEEAMENGSIERSSIQRKFKSTEELEIFIEEVIGFAKGYVDGIARGQFALVRADRRTTSCAHCEYQAVCRIAQAEADGVLPVGVS